MGAGPSYTINLTFYGPNPMYLAVQSTATATSTAPALVFWSGISLGTTFYNATHVMASVFPIGFEEVEALMTTGKPTSAFVGVSWSSGQPAPVPPATKIAFPLLPPPLAITVPPIFTMNNMTILYQEPTSSMINMYIYSAYLPFSTAFSKTNPNNAPVPAPVKTHAWTAPITAGVVLGAIALLLVLVVIGMGAATMVKMKQSPSGLPRPT